MKKCVRCGKEVVDEIDICEVIGFGQYIMFEDYFYDYYDMYSFEKIQIIKNMA